MTKPTFDTHAYIKALQAAGITPEQAEAHAQVLQEQMENVRAESKYKLDAIDYENIYLQTRNRISKWLVAILGTIGVVTIFSAYRFINRSIEAGVATYIKSDDFQKKIVDAAMTRFDKLEDRTIALNKEIVEISKRAAIAGNLPIGIDKNGLTLTSKDGTNFHIETGEAISGDIVKFKKPFSAPPLLIVGDAPLRTTMQIPNSYLDEILEGKIEPIMAYQYKAFIKNSPANFVESTKTGFLMNGTIRSLNQTHTWIAIGK